MDRADSTDKIHVAGEDSEHDMKIHDKVEKMWREYNRVENKLTLCYLMLRNDMKRSKGTDQKGRRKLDERAKQGLKRGVISAISRVWSARTWVLESMGGEAQMRIRSCGCRDGQTMHVVCT